MKTKIWGVALTLSLLMISIVLFSRTAKTTDARDPQTVENESSVNKELLSNQLGQAIRVNSFPEMFDLNMDGETKKTHIQYTLHEASQAQMQKLMNQYQPDYGAFVAMDAKTGRILSLVSYSKLNPQLENLTLRATFPAASIFKIVTASAAVDLNKASPKTVVPFNGAYHTLYKKNVESNVVNRWTRKITLSEAFGKSVNTFFGKLGLFYVGPQHLLTYAERYMFNHPINADVPVQAGMAKFSADDPWSVVTAASGFTRDNTMSPLQGALIASAIANDGVMMEPYLVDSLTSEQGEALYQAVPRQASVVVEPESAEKLRELFRTTVQTGTSRKSFRDITRRSRFDDVEFGGKTGSLTGLDPVGKCDWFVGYARYGEQRIAVAALTVNEKKWKVKSSMLANLFFSQYLKELKTAELAANR